MLSGRTAIAGIGATEFSKASGRSELQLAAEAIRAALAECAIEPAQVDGLVTFSLDTSPENVLAETVGLGGLSYFSRVPFGGGAGCGCLLHAAMAVVTGVAEVVVVYRALNERSGTRFGKGMAVPMPIGPVEMGDYGWYSGAGLIAPAHWAALIAGRYAYEFGATSEDFGRVTVAARDFAATNPDAFFHRRPLSLEEHQSSPWVVRPLRLLDCCQESDGGVALVVTSTERARDCPTTPAVIAAAAQASAAGEQLMTSFYRESITGLPSMGRCAERAYRMSGLGPADIQAAMIYDHFTPFVLMQLEELGFAQVGEAKELVRDGAIGRGGRLPVNTNGGQLGEAYMHGMNGITEAVRQVRGTAVNQVSGVQHVVVTSGTGLPTSAAILGTDR